MKQLLINQPRFNPLMAVAVMAAVGVIGYVAVTTLAASVLIYLAPETKELRQDQIFDVEVRVDTADETINGVSVDLNYPVDKLALLDINHTGSDFSTGTRSSHGEGRIRVDRSSIIPMSGDLLITTLTFNVVASSGQAAIKFNDGSVYSLNILEDSLASDTKNSNYTIKPATAPSTTKPPQTDTPTGETDAASPPADSGERPPDEDEDRDLPADPDETEDEQVDTPAAAPVDPVAEDSDETLTRSVSALVLGSLAALVGLAAWAFYSDRPRQLVQSLLKKSQDNQPFKPHPNAQPKPLYPEIPTASVVYPKKAAEVKKHKPKTTTKPKSTSTKQSAKKTSKKSNKKTKTKSTSKRKS